MGTLATPNTDGSRWFRSRFWLALAGPLLLFLGSALAIWGLFLPWSHYQPSYTQPCPDPTISDCQLFVPAVTYGLDDLRIRMLLWPVVAALVVGVVILLIDAIPILRRRPLLTGMGALAGTLAILAGLFGIGVAWLTNFFGLDDSPWVKITDGGYYLTTLGFALLVPGAILLIRAQNRLAAAVRLAAATPAAQQAISRPKSIGVAALLEWFVPGAGAMYAGEVGIGSGWLAGTLVTAVILGFLLYFAVGLYVNFLPTTSSVMAMLALGAIIVLLGLGWFAARFRVVNGWVRAVNQSIDSGAVGVEPAERPLFESGRASSSVALAIAFLLIGFMLGILGFGNVFLIAELLAFAFWLALMRLARVSWWRALIETLIGMLVMEFVVLLGSDALYSLHIGAQYPVQRLLTIYSSPMLFLPFALVPVLVASLMGWGAALIFAPWRRVREAGQVGRNSLLFAAVAPLFGVVVLPLLSLFQQAASLEPYNLREGAFWYILPLVICAAVVLAGALLMRQWLKRAA